MKWWVFGTKLVCFLALLGACSTSEKAKEDRSPASIREVASYLNKKVKKKRPRVKFLKDLKNKKIFAKSSGINLKESKGIRFFSSDSNDDGKTDTITGIKKGQIYSLKIDRNFDGKFDRFESLKKGVKTVKYDDNFDGKVDKVVTVKQVSSNKAIKTVYHTKTKKNTTYPLLVSNHDSQDSEGKFCGDCEEGFRKAVRDLRSDEAKEKQNDEWTDKVLFEDIDVYETEPGYALTYLKIEPSIWFSESCSTEGDKLAFMISDAINDYFDCMNDWRKKGSNSNEKDLIKKRNANRLMQGLVGVASDTKRPLKIHCEDDSSLGGGWTISSKGDLHGSANPTKIPPKDAIGSIVLNISKTKDHTDAQKKDLILHEITHLFSGSHGDGQDNFTSCSALCLGGKSIGKKESHTLSEKRWAEVRPSFEKVCLADREIKKDGSTNLDPRPYSYLNNVFKIYEVNTAGYSDKEFGDQIIREIIDRKGTGSIPIQKLSIEKREELVFNYLISFPSWDKKRALKFISEFEPNSDNNLGHKDTILPALVLDSRPITYERMDDLQAMAKELHAEEDITESLRYIRGNL